MFKALNDRSIVMEQLLLIGHIAHLEVHYLEMIERTDSQKVKDFLMGQIVEVRNMRTRNMMKLHPEIETIWCAIKHAVMGYIHALELAEKTGDLAYCDESKRLMLLIDDLLSKEFINGKNIKSCPRCDEEVTAVKKTVE